EIDEVVVGGQQRRGLGVCRLKRVVGVGAIDGIERVSGALEQESRLLHRAEGIVERRRRGLIRDCGGLALLLRHSGEDRGQIVAVLDPRKVRGPERQCARLREWVRGWQGGRCRGRGLVSHGRRGGGGGNGYRCSRKENVAHHDFSCGWLH